MNFDIQGGRVGFYCSIMLNNEKSPLENLALIHKNPQNKDNEERNDNEWNWAKTWDWQTCTEFGWYQTTDSGRNIFGTAISLDFSVNYECLKQFGININDIAESVEYTLKNYGGIENYNATNIVFVNGSNDPWHAISLYTNNTSPTGITSILINGTAHCYDMYPPSESDSAELKAARQKIGELIGEWLK
uniref:Uncharacterized protein n=1 Tax=Panagrolaimus davidi TaxID=227884 RepID=A0A914QCE4_9BILA